MAALLRFADTDDAAAIAAIYGPFCESTPVSFEICPPTVEEISARIERITAQYPWLVCEIDGRVRAYAYAYRYRERYAYQWAADVAIYSSPENRRCGVGRGLYTALLAMLREQGYFRVHAGITLPNAASAGLHEALGFRPVGVYPGVGYKLGKWHDVGWWQLQIQPERDDPPPPRPIAPLRDTEPVVAALAAGARHIRSTKPAS